AFPDPVPTGRRDRGHRNETAARADPPGTLAGLAPRVAAESTTDTVSPPSPTGGYPVGIGASPIRRAYDMPSRTADAAAGGECHSPTRRPARPAARSRRPARAAARPLPRDSTGRPPA